MATRPRSEVERNTLATMKRSAQTTSCALEAAKTSLRDLGSPVVIFCKSHSGSRLLARLVEAAGVYMGAHLNESSDSLDLLRLVEHLVVNFYPDYGPLWGNRLEAVELASTVSLVLKVFEDHLQTQPIAGGRWGWKLCETLYALPVIDYLFPNARYIHLLRDGRDVAFCNHTPPDTPFWKKVYFNTDRLDVWQSYALSYKDYHRHSHIFNALHWSNSVQIGRSYGAMLRDRYLEVRYEDLCRDFRSESEIIFRHLGITDRNEVIDQLQGEVYTQSIGKHQQESPSRLLAVLQIEKSLLLELGYLDTDPFRRPSRSFKRRMSGLFAAWRSRKLSSSE